MEQYTSQQVQADHALALRERNDIRFARTRANIARRAETLFTDGGYAAERAFTGLYHIWGPEGQHYSVLCDDIAGHDCDCPAFAKYGECKHHLAVASLRGAAADDARWEALAADHDAQEAGYADFDPYEFRH